MLFLVAVASCLVCVQSQKVFFGGCPSTTIMPNFDPNQVSVSWFHIWLALSWWIQSIWIVVFRRLVWESKVLRNIRVWSTLHQGKLCWWRQRQHRGHKLCIGNHVTISICLFISRNSVLHAHEWFKPVSIQHFLNHFSLKYFSTGSPTSVTGIGSQVSPPSGALGVTFASTTSKLIFPLICHKITIHCILLLLWQLLPLQPITWYSALIIHLTPSSGVVTISDFSTPVSCGWIIKRVAFQPVKSNWIANICFSCRVPLDFDSWTWSFGIGGERSNCCHR